LAKWCEEGGRYFEDLGETYLSLNFVHTWETLLGDLTMHKRCLEKIHSAAVMMGFWSSLSLKPSPKCRIICLSRRKSILKRRDLEVENELLVLSVDKLSKAGYMPCWLNGVRIRWEIFQGPWGDLSLI
jgi:hypothetical protein